MNPLITFWTFFPNLMGFDFAPVANHTMGRLLLESGFAERNSLQPSVEPSYPEDVPPPEPPMQPTPPTPTDVPTPEPFDVPVPDPTDVPAPEPHDVPQQKKQSRLSKEPPRPKQGPRPRSVP
jgi:outer membrane biosynthesis protein TonB